MKTSPVALVTGGGSGIGFEAARALAGSGWDVAIAGRRLEVLHEAARKITEEHPGQRVECFRVNLANADEAMAAVDEVVGAFGRLDGLVCVAGAYTTTPFVDLTPEIWDEANDVLVRGTAFVAVRASKHMSEHGGGRIVFVGSVTGFVAEYGSAHYTAAKSASHSLARSIAIELGQSGVTANVVASGFVKTPMTAKLHEHENQEMAQGVMSRINPLGRPGEPSEIANVIRYLIVDAPTYLTGSIITVDGAQVVQGVVKRAAAGY